MPRPPGRKHATPEQDAKALELKDAYGTFTKAVHEYVIEGFRPAPGMERGETFTTLDVGQEMGVHRSHVSGVLGRWDDPEFDLQHENKTHYYLQRKSARTEVQPPWTPPKASPGGLTEVPSYILQRNPDGSLVLWIDGGVYIAKPLNLGD